MDLTVSVHVTKNRGETGYDCCAWSLSAWSSKYLWETTTQLQPTMSMNWSSYCSWRPHERLPQQIGSASSSTDVAAGAKQGNCRETQTVSNRQLKRGLTWHSHYALVYNYESTAIRRLFDGRSTQIIKMIPYIRSVSQTRSSADADNRLDAFSGQSRSTNMVPFHMLHIVSYCAIVTLSLRRAVFTIFVFKKFHDLEMGVKGHSMYLRVVSFDRLCMVSY